MKLQSLKISKLNQTTLNPRNMYKCKNFHPSKSHKSIGLNTDKTHPSYSYQYLVKQLQRPIARMATPRFLSVSSTLVIWQCRKLVIKYGNGNSTMNHWSMASPLNILAAKSANDTAIPIPHLKSAILG